MMKIEDIANLLESTGLPVAYDQFDEDTALPCIIYFESNTPTFGADDKVYAMSHHIVIELYTLYRELETEEHIEEALDEAEIFWTKTPTHLKDEHCYLITYEIEV